MARMLGEAQGSHCPSCHELPGIDCSDKGTSTRHQKRVEDRAWWPFEVAAEGWARLDEVWDRAEG